MVRSIRTITLLFAAAALWCSPVGAQTNEGAGAFPWEGEVTGSNVFVRSGAGNNFYPTAKLNAGDRVLVLGEKFGWFQIAPPTGSFSYVDSNTVDRKPGAKTGTVKQDKVYVRAGSKIEKRKSSTQLVLNKGATVEITGEDDGFYQIKPPAGATLFITKQYVKPVGAAAKAGLVEQHVSDKTNSGTPTNSGAPESQQPKSEPVVPPPTSTDSAMTDVTTSTPTEPGRTPLPADADTGAPTNSDATTTDTQPEATAPGDKKSTPKKTAPKPKATGKDSLSKKGEPAPTTPPTTGRFKVMLTVVEGDLANMLRRPFDEQDFASIVKKYEPIANQTEENIPSQIAKIRMKQLSNRAEFRLARSDLDKDSKEIADLRANMDKERMKIMTKRYEKAAERYELEGELKESFAFAPENRRYRLVDPTSKMTIAYVDIPASVKGNPQHLIGQLVGIKVETKSFSPSARVPIAIASEVVDLSTRKLPDGGVRIPAGTNNEVQPPPEDAQSKEAAAAGKPAVTHEPAANAAEKIDSDN